MYGKRESRREAFVRKSNYRQIASALGQDLHIAKGWLAKP
jgi:hypothetical protein